MYYRLYNNQVKDFNDYHLNSRYNGTIESQIRPVFYITFFNIKQIVSNNR